MRFGFKFRVLIVKTLVFLVMALMAGFSVVFLSRVFIPLIFVVLVILVVLINRTINKRMNEFLGREIAHVGNDYVIYEGGIYIKPLDAFYLWSDIVNVRSDSANNAIITFSDGSELTLPMDIVKNFINKTTH